MGLSALGEFEFLSLVPHSFFIATVSKQTQSLTHPDLPETADNQ